MDKIKIHNVYQKYFELNINKNTTYQIMLDEFKYREKYRL